MGSGEGEAGKEASDRDHKMVIAVGMIVAG